MDRAGGFLRPDWRYHRPVRYPYLELLLILATYAGILVEHRGDDTVKLFSYMDKLRDQALAAGGMVLSHLGNHEWMNVIGMFSESHSSYTRPYPESLSLRRLEVCRSRSICTVAHIHLDMFIHQKSRHSVQLQQGRR